MQNLAVPSIFMEIGNFHASEHESSSIHATALTVRCLLKINLGMQANFHGGHAPACDSCSGESCSISPALYT